MTDMGDLAAGNQLVIPVDEEISLRPAALAVGSVYFNIPYGVVGTTHPDRVRSTIHYSHIVDITARCHPGKID